MCSTLTMIFRNVLFVLLAVLVGCSVEPPAAELSPTAPATYAISLAVDSSGMLAGDSIVPAVSVIVDGVTRPALLSEITVASSDTTVIAIASNGALMVVGDGQSNITVALVATPSVSVTRRVTVRSELLNAVSLNTLSTLLPGDTAAFSVIGTIRGGRQVSVQPA